MKKTFVLSSFIAFSLAAIAAPRGEEAAREIAYMHFNQRINNASSRTRVLSMSELTLAGTATSILESSTQTTSKHKVSAKFEPFYVYNHGTEAFVIVSGADEFEPILAYSDQGSFDANNMPEAVKYWLQMYSDEMAQASITNSTQKKNVGEISHRNAAYPASASPLLQYKGEPIQWDQNSPFNKECPTYLSYMCPVGCVATAFGQIMYYHRWPEKGQGGTKTYISEPNNFSQSFTYTGTTFDYDKMLPKYNYGKYTEEQGAEVAKLCHGIGVAVDMQYDPAGSGAYSIYCGDPIIKYFNYDKNLHYAYRDYFTQDEWINMIKKEISEGRPICYAGSSTSVGHQFVFDGYDAQNRIHVNWGWAGMSDGYFALTSLSPSNTGTGGGSVTSGGFIYNQAMWMGMQRPTEASAPVSFFTHNYYMAMDGKYSDSYLKIDKTSAMEGEKVTLTTTEIANLSIKFSGIFGLIIEDANGNQTVLNETSAKTISCGAFSRDEDILTQTGTIPTGLADGNYTIYMASKANGEVSWSRIRAAEGYCDYYDMNVKDGKATFSYNGTPDADGVLIADHTIYTKCRCQFTAKITNNNNREFFGIARVGVFTANADGSYTLIARCGMEQVTLPSHKETNIVFRGPIEAATQGTTVSTGDYKACAIVECQGKYYQVSEFTDITIKRIPSGMASLDCNEYSLTKESYGIDEPIEGYIKVTNTRSVYSDYLGIIIFKGGSNQGVPYWEKELFLEKDGSSDFHFSIPPQFEPGTYHASLRYTGGAEYSNELDNIAFEVRDEYVGINTVNTDNAAHSDHRIYDVNGTLRTSLKPGINIVRKADGSVVKIYK